MPTVLIKSIICINPDEIDKDEIFLKVNGKKIWPEHGHYKKTDSGDKTEVNLEIEHEPGILNVELWDYDFLSRNDKLGDFTMTIDDERGITNTAGLRRSDDKSTASYMLEWKVSN